MPSGFQGYISSFEDDNYTGSLYQYPQALYIESESLALNFDLKDNANQMFNGRVKGTWAQHPGPVKPKGNLTFEFRSDDCLKFLYNHFQLGTGGVGTVINAATYYYYSFFPLQNNFKPLGIGGGDFLIQPYGSYSTVPYTISILKKYFDTSNNGGTNAIWFKHGISENLEFYFTGGANSRVSADFRFLDYDAGTPVSSNPENSTVGSYSKLNPFAFNNAAIYFDNVLTGTKGTIDLSSFSFKSAQTFVEINRVGKMNTEFLTPSTYKLTGNLSFNLPSDAMRHIGSLLGSQNFQVMATAYNTSGTLDSFYVEMLNCRRTPFEYKQVGDAPLSASIPFEAFGVGTVPPLTINVTSSYSFNPFTLSYLYDASFGARTIGNYAFFDGTMGTRTLGAFIYLDRDG